MLNKCKKELIAQKRTITNYRKAVTDMQKDFFGGSSMGGATSSITMTSVGLGGFKNNASISEENVDRVDDAISTTSGAVRDKEIKDSFNKVQSFLESNSRFPKSAMRSGGHPHGNNRAIKINYNTVCDFDRADKFRGVISSLSNAKKLPKLISIVIKNIPIAISCYSCAVFVTRRDLIMSRQLAEH